MLSQLSRLTKSVSCTYKLNPRLNEGGFASTILRKQTDGHWKIVIDNPWGPAILESDGLGL